MTFIDGFDSYLLEEAGMDQGQKLAKHRAEMLSAVRPVCKCAMAVTILAACLLLCGGCGATITVNVLSSHSRYGQAIGGTNTTIRGQIEGGGSATGTLTP